MNKKSRFTIVSALALGAIGLAIGAYSLIGGQAAEAQGGYVSTSNTYRFADASVVDGGSATLVRDKNGLSTTLQTGDLREGHAYTMWWVIFNNPEQCEHGMLGLTNCGEGDVFGEPFGDTPVQVSVQYASGNVIGETGMGNFGARLAEGQLPVGSGQPVFGPGLYNSHKSEVHLVVRDHGPAMPGMDTGKSPLLAGPALLIPILPRLDRWAPTPVRTSSSPSSCPERLQKQGWLISSPLNPDKAPAPGMKKIAGASAFASKFQTNTCRG